MQIIKAKLIQIIDWLTTQFNGASDAVEYISWLTAAIFSVLAVFTIFLAHQYQSNTSELFKIIWRIREAAKKEDQHSFKQLFEDYSYLSNIPNVVTKSIKICQTVIYSLVAIWSLSGLSILVDKSFNKEGQFQYILCLFILSITAVFIFFSIQLLNIIQQITNEGNNDLKIKNINELKNLNILHQLRYPMKEIIKFDNITWEFNVLHEDPYFSTFINREYGFNNCHVLINISRRNSYIFLGTILDNDEVEQEFVLTTSAQKKINKFFVENNIEACEVYISYLIDSSIFSYKAKVDTDDETNHFFTLTENSIWSPPPQIKDELIQNNTVELINIMR
ncbi:hypothetical protein [Bacillus cereus]|uniref:hypothetical protein n=1 Tax=Bacillus cereus TaxID=1396 RepID=UPI002ABF1908|nr:hypothetical protein [Bacillus cereus]MDZ4567231.1 hypothetical protein [Bacillus cereus]